MLTYIGITKLNFTNNYKKIQKKNFKKIKLLKGTQSFYLHISIHLITNFKQFF